MGRRVVTDSARPVAGERRREALVERTVGTEELQALMVTAVQVRPGRRRGAARAGPPGNSAPTRVRPLVATPMKDRRASAKPSGTRTRRLLLGAVVVGTGRRGGHHQRDDQGQDAGQRARSRQAPGGQLILYSVPSRRRHVELARRLRRHRSHAERAGADREGLGDGARVVRSSWYSLPLEPPTHSTVLPGSSWRRCRPRRVSSSTRPTPTTASARRPHVAIGRHEVEPSGDVEVLPDEALEGGSTGDRVGRLHQRRQVHDVEDTGLVTDPGASCCRRARLGRRREIGARVPRRATPPLATMSRIQILFWLLPLPSRLATYSRSRA